MAQLRAYRLLTVALFATALVAVGCGSQGIEVDENSPDRKGAELFSDRCSGCHTLKAAGSEGSGSDRKSVGPPTSGPNLDGRKETVASTLYAIRNGGFSGAIMPQNIVVGQDAQAVAGFVAKYAGSEKTSADAPGREDIAAAKSKYQSKK